MIVRILSTTIQMLLLAAIGLYRLVLRPLLPPSCRFYPSCSEYACLSLKKYGPFKGGWRALFRLLKCHPFHPGGVDMP
jgi:hypothetical protein